MKLFELDFYEQDLKNLVREIKLEIDLKRKVSVFTPNVDHIINNKNDKKIEKIYAESEYIIADGWPVVVSAKLKGKSINRITGVDLMDEIIDLADKERYGIFFLGATDETLEKIKKNIFLKYKDIKNIKYHNGYFSDNEAVIQKINESNCKILFVGMGNPKQEIWVRKYLHKMDVNLAIGVGGAFKIFSNEVNRAPKYIQKIGLEWFYRFLKEPKRLFSRYFIKYPKFIKIAIKELNKSEI